MRLAAFFGLLSAAAALAACESGRQETVALREVRPAPAPAQLAAYAARQADYPSVGGDILRGAAPTTGAAYEATTGDNPPPAPPVER